jgi:hypothetical protein
VRTLVAVVRCGAGSDPVEIGLPAACGPQFGKKLSSQGSKVGSWSSVPKHPEVSILGVNCEAMGLSDSTSIGIEWHSDSAPGGGHVWARHPGRVAGATSTTPTPTSGSRQRGSKIKSTHTLGCATVIYCVLAPEEGGETLFAQ